MMIQSRRFSVSTHITHDADFGVTCVFLKVPRTNVFFLRHAISMIAIASMASIHAPFHLAWGLTFITDSCSWSFPFSQLRYFWNTLNSSTGTHFIGILSIHTSPYFSQVVILKTLSMISDMHNFKYYHFIICNNYGDIVTLSRSCVIFDYLT